jgi:hypothetical protein
VSTFILTDRVTGLSRGIGFCRFETEEGAAEAMSKMNGVTVEGAQLALSITIAKDKTKARLQPMHPPHYQGYGYPPMQQQQPMQYGGYSPGPYGGQPQQYYQPRGGPPSGYYGQRGMGGGRQGGGRPPSNGQPRQQGGAMYAPTLQSGPNGPGPSNGQPPQPQQGQPPQGQQGGPGNGQTAWPPTLFNYPQA